MELPILIIQQVEYEPAALIEDVIHSLGRETKIIMAMDELVPQALSAYSGLIIMGGHISANDEHLEFVAKQIRLLKWCIKYDYPVLGICLGAQMLAKAAGGEIMISPLRELGWYPLRPTFFAQGDPLFGAILPHKTQVLQWHGETFSLPASATLLATCPDVINQAFRIKSRLYGLQFHTEMTEDLIYSWIENGTSETAYLGESGVKQLLKNVPRYVPAANSFCKNMTEAWTKLL